MDLKQLEYFVRVAELGSFTRASVALNVAQPALSRQVRLLEVELHQTLLTRNGRGALPTEAGKLLLAHGRGILHQIERAREELGRVRGSLAGRVAVGLPTSLARALTVPLMRAFRTQLPDATISITEGLSAALQDALIAGRLDLALLYNAQPCAELETTLLHQEDLVLVQAVGSGSARADAPSAIGLAEVTALPLIIPTRPNAFRVQLEAEAARIGRRLNIALEIDGVSAILDLVAEDAGCAVLSRNAVRNSLHPERYLLRTIREPQLQARVALASSSLRPATRTQQSTQDLLKRTVQTVLCSTQT